MSGLVFSTSTRPLLATVEGWLDDVADVINMELQASAYTMPVSSSTNKEAHGRLVLANSAGAAAMALATFPGEALDPDNPEAFTSRVNELKGILKDVLDRIAAREFVAAKDIERVERIFAGSQQDSDGNVKKPVWSRGMYDFPGAQSRTET